MTFVTFQTYKFWARSLWAYQINVRKVSYSAETCNVISMANDWTFVFPLRLISLFMSLFILHRIYLLSASLYVSIYLQFLKYFLSVQWQHMRVLVYFKKNIWKIAITTYSSTTSQSSWCNQSIYQFCIFASFK